MSILTAYAICAMAIVIWFTIQISEEEFSLPRHFDGILRGFALGIEPIAHSPSGCNFIATLGLMWQSYIVQLEILVY